MKRFAAGLSAAAVVIGTLSTASLYAQDKTEIKDADRLEAARKVIEEVEATPDKSIPQSILAGANCVVVIPSVIKGAFIIGGERGKGVATCRTPRGWSAPVFVALTGVSGGFQIGGQATDLILVSENPNGLTHLLSDQFKIGGDASAAAGPVGRDAQASTDILLHAEFLTYSRAKGLFAGIDLNGAVVRQDKDDTRAEYGSDIPFQTVLHGGTPAPENAKPFLHTMAHYFVVAKTNH